MVLLSNSPYIRRTNALFSSINLSICSLQTIRNRHSRCYWHDLNTLCKLKYRYPLHISSPALPLRFCISHLRRFLYAILLTHFQLVGANAITQVTSGIRIRDRDLKCREWGANLIPQYYSAYRYSDFLFLIVFQRSYYESKNNNTYLG